MEGFTVSLAGPHGGDVGLNLAVSAWHVLSLAQPDPVLGICPLSTGKAPET